MISTHCFMRLHNINLEITNYVLINSEHFLHVQVLVGACSAGRFDTTLQYREQITFLISSKGKYVHLLQMCACMECSPFPEYDFSLIVQFQILLEAFLEYCRSYKITVEVKNYQVDCTVARVGVAAMDSSPFLV